MISRPHKKARPEGWPNGPRIARPSTIVLISERAFLCGHLPKPSAELGRNVVRKGLFLEESYRRCVHRMVRRSADGFGR